MTESPEDFQDQDAEPTMTAPGEGRPDGTVASDPGADSPTEESDGTQPENE